MAGKAAGAISLPAKEGAMQDHVYKVIELAGSSERSAEDAIRSAIARASSTLKHLRWFEVVQTRGHLENGEIRHWQVVLKVGFTLE
jgi:flavin-binding protein dodecin